MKSSSGTMDRPTAKTLMSNQSHTFEAPVATPAEPDVKPRRPSFLGHVDRYVVVLLLLLVWQVSVDRGLLMRDFLPSPTDIARAFYNFTFVDRSIWENFAASATRLLWGIGLSILIALPLGVAMGWSRRFHRWVSMLIELTRPIPPIAMIPVGIFYLGIGDASKVFIIWLACFFPLLMNTIAGIRGIDPVLIKAARTLGTPTGRMLLRVALPSALPNILTGVRVSIGIGLMVLVAAEMVAATTGLGFFILQSEMTWKLDDMYAGIAVISMAGLSLNAMLLRLERRLTHWHQGSR